MKLHRTPIIGDGYGQKAVFRTEVREEAAKYDIRIAVPSEAALYFLSRLLPSFPEWAIVGTRPRKLSWFLKAGVLPWIYRKAMLKGHEGLVKPQVRKAV